MCAGLTVGSEQCVVPSDRKISIFPLGEKQKGQGCCKSSGFVADYLLLEYSDFCERSSSKFAFGKAFWRLAHRRYHLIQGMLLYFAISTKFVILSRHEWDWECSESFQSPTMT